MPTSFDTHQIIVLAFAALVVWRIHARIRRAIGRQRLSTVRPWITVFAFPLIFVLLLSPHLSNSRVGLAALAGAAVGACLGVLGTRLTRFEATPAGLFYTPNAYLSVALSLLLVLRLAWRFVMLQTAGTSVDPPSMLLGASLPTVAIFGTLAGYYVTCAIGLLRWRARIGAQANAEH